MNLKETTQSQEYLYKGRIINLRRDTVSLPDGKEALREVVEHNGGVCVAALTDKDELLFVRQFRYPYMEELLEIPAGKRDSADEEPLSCGKRELLEETGAKAEEWISLGELYPSPGYCAEHIWIFLAVGLSFGEQHLDADEFLEVERIPLETATEMVLNGEITDAKTQAAVLKVALMKQQGKV